MNYFAKLYLSFFFLRRSITWLNNVIVVAMLTQGVVDNYLSLHINRTIRLPTQLLLPPAHRPPTAHSPAWPLNNSTSTGPHCRIQGDFFSFNNIYLMVVSSGLCHNKVI